MTDYDCYEIWSWNCYFTCYCDCRNMVTGETWAGRPGGCGQCTVNGDCENNCVSHCNSFNASMWHGPGDYDELLGDGTGSPYDPVRPDPQPWGGNDKQQDKRDPYGSK